MTRVSVAIVAAFPLATSALWLAAVYHVRSVMGCQEADPATVAGAPGRPILISTVMVTISLFHFQPMSYLGLCAGIALSALSMRVVTAISRERQIRASARRAPGRLRDGPLTRPREV